MVTKSKQEILQNMLSPTEFKRVATAFGSVIKQSFDEDGGRLTSDIIHLSTNIKASEIKERVNLCYDLFMMMRGDMHYSIPRALDMLPRALRSKLDTGHWEPPKTERASWGLPRQ